MRTEHMDTAQPSELACLPQELRSLNDAQDLLLLQDYVCKLLHAQQTLEATYTSLQQTGLLAGVIHEQDCRAIRTACCCLNSLLGEIHDVSEFQCHFGTSFWEPASALF